MKVQSPAYADLNANATEAVQNTGIVSGLEPSALGPWRSRFARVHGRECARSLRRQLLREALECRGLTLRNDSVMCSRYIRDGPTAVQGGLAQVVSIMAEMDFFFSETAYGWKRRDVAEELEERAEGDARDAFVTGEDEAINPEKYFEDLTVTEISDIAKRRALHSFVRDMHAKHSDKLGPRELLQVTLATAPSTLHAQLERLHSLLIQEGSGIDNGASHTSLLQFGALPGEEEEPVARRARLRAAAPRESPLELRMAEHVEALRAFFRRESGAENDNVLAFPPSLLSEERALLHEHAEALGLWHGSEGFGTERMLVVRTQAIAAEDAG